MEKHIYTIRYIKEYLKSIRLIELYEKGYYLVNEKLDEKTIQQFYLIKTIFEGALNSLDYENKIFIENEYLKGNYNNWWLNKYSRSTYYRRKSLAHNQLLEALKDNGSLIIDSI